MANTTAAVAVAYFAIVFIPLSSECRLALLANR